jgi:hypothetical protein
MKKLVDVSDAIKYSYIKTYTGKIFYPLAPTLDQICIEDIAHALSNVCRYGGHCEKTLTVAQHSCMVSDWLPQYKLEGLMHDGTEAYLGDMVRPLKHSPKMRQYRLAENKLDIILHEKFDLDPAARKLVKEYDNRALATEMKLLFSDRTISFEPLPITKYVVWSHQRSKKEFMKRWEKLK